jgi:chaperonin GroES
LHDRVIVKPAPAEERGTIVAAGPGKKDEPVTVKVGDAVLYGKYAGTEINIAGEDLLIMRESDILAIV